MKKQRKNKITYDDPITYENILSMWEIIRKTCKNKRALFRFSLNLNTNINYIYYVLKTRTYRPRPYRTFMIFEPKPRLVMSQTIQDKIVNHFIANFYLIPTLERSLIDTNVATRNNKGSKYAMEMLTKYLNHLLITEKDKEIYCLKIDIHKYFYSIDHNILISKLEKRIKDKEIIDLIKIVISETNSPYINESIDKFRMKYKIEIPYYHNQKGLSIGAMSSQFLAIYYLNDLDHYIKEILKCKYYIRYMDDFLILDTNKEQLKIIWRKIEEQINGLNLTTNSKSNIYKASKGFSFLGYTYKVINKKLLISCYKKTALRIKKKLSYLEAHNPIKYHKTLPSYYGYFLEKKDKERDNFKMKLIEKYEMYKKQYPNDILIMKDGIFYKTFYDDALIIWYLFDYKYVNNQTSFGTTPYDKVLAKLNKLDISYVVISNEKEIFEVKKDDDNYISYSNLSKKSYQKVVKNKELTEKLNKILETSPDKYEEINKMLESFI